MAVSKYKKLAKNTAIFAVGNFSTKILSFLIVPLYTYVLTTEEYGRIDLFVTTLSFLVPIMTLSIQEALIRYLLGKEVDENTAISNCWAVYIVGAVISVLLFPLYRLYLKDENISLIFTILLLFNSFNAIFTHYLRSIGRNIAYTIKGIIDTIVLLSFNVIFLIFMHLGMMGYLYSMAISQLVGCVYLLFVGKLWNKLNLKHLNYRVLKKMVRFSMPLIPNSLMWWIMSAGDKYIINYFLGDSANGIYSLSLKIPTIITMLYSIFFQAWQMSAIEENDSKEREEFYSTIYRLTNALLIGIVALIIIGIKPLYVLVMNNNFATAWVYVPILSIATAFNCQSSFFGVVYTTAEKTTRAFGTTALGATMNLIFNFALIKPLGLQGVAVGTCMGYIVVALVRARDAKKEINMDFDIKRTFLAVAIVFIQSIITIYIGNIGIIVVGIISISLLVKIYYYEICEIVNKCRILFRRK